MSRRFENPGLGSSRACRQKSGGRSRRGLALEMLEPRRLLNGAGITTNDFHWKLLDVSQYNPGDQSGLPIVTTLMRSDAAGGAPSNGGLIEWPPPGDQNAPLQGTSQSDTLTVTGSDFSVVQQWSGAPANLQPGESFTIVGTTTASGSGAVNHVQGPAYPGADPSSAQATAEGNYGLEGAFAAQATSTGDGVDGSNLSGTCENVIQAPVVSDFPFKHMANFVVLDSGFGATFDGTAFAYLYVPVPGAAPGLRAPRVTAPSGTVSNTEPTFTWTPVPGAGSYGIIVTDITPGIRGGVVPVQQDDLSGTSFTLPFTLNPLHSYQVKIRALDANSNPGPWSSPRNFKIAEQLTTQFRIRLLSSIELSGLIGAARFKFTLQATADDQGRQVLGPPKYLTFYGTGVGFDGKIPFGFSGTSDWVELTTPTPMYTRDFDVAGTLLLYPSISLGIVGTDTRATVAFIPSPSRKFTQYLDLSSSSIGITILTEYGGKWTVGGYDTSLWPNYVNT